ncbi:MAG: HAMP domain-containing histidine kinase [Caulobacter sp.]|nr:HAMP domain-containing histidine kinase [Caulobacter sp.]
MRDRFRISARPGLLAAVLGVCIAVLLTVSMTVIDITGEAQIVRRQRLVAGTARDYFVAFAHEEGLAAMARALDRRDRLEAGAFTFAVFNDSGRLIGGDTVMPFAKLPGPGFTTLTVGDRSYEVLVQPMATSGTLAIFEDLADRQDFRNAVLGAVFAALFVSLLAVATASVWLQRLLVRRARGIAAAAERIAGGDLSARAPTAPGGDVFDDLGRSVNTMLVRIEDLLGDLRLVTDSLAHDLRLPLARLRAALAQAADPALPAAERLAQIERADRGADQILATISSLLDIARAESGLSRESMAPLDLAPLVEEMVELFTPMIEDAGQTLTLSLPPAPTVIPAHALLLRQALGNLLHNASRYGGQGAEITVRLDRSPFGARITVTDNGPGVPAGDRERVLHRFVRLDESRTLQGSGLGLAIVAACAKLHGGEVRLEDAAPGLRVVLNLAS